MAATQESESERADGAGAETRATTTYVLLKRVVVHEGRVGEGDAWAEVAEIKATNKIAALRKGIEKLAESDREGEFKAVAQSAWAGGVKSSTETVTKTKYEEID